MCCCFLCPHICVMLCVPHQVTPPCLSDMLLTTPILNDHISFAIPSPPSSLLLMNWKVIQLTQKRKCELQIQTEIILIKKIHCISPGVYSVQSFHSAEFGCDLPLRDLCLFKECHTYTADVLQHLLFVQLEKLSRPELELQTLAHRQQKIRFCLRKDVADVDNFCY